MNNEVSVGVVKGGITRREWRLMVPLCCTLIVAMSILHGIGVAELVYPPVVLVGLLAARHFGQEWLLWWAVAINAVAAVAYVLVVRRRRGGHFGEFLAEERKYRVGSEDWTVSRRAVSCVMFGITRVTKFFYPVSAILTTALTGAAYLWIYRKAGLEGVLRVRYAVLNALVYLQKLFIVTLLCWVCINS